MQNTEYAVQRLEQWLAEHKGEITHFRPRKWCGVAMLIAYNRRNAVPYIEGQPIIEDTEANAAVIRAVLGAGLLAEPFAAVSASRY